MTTKFEIDTNFVAPTKPQRSESELTRKMDALEIGQGAIVYVADGETKPTLKNQYSRVAPSKWAARGKTFRVFVHPDQSGIDEDTQTRFAIARVEFEQYTPRKRNTAEAVEAAE